MDTFTQQDLEQDLEQDLAHTAVSDRPAGVAPRIILPPQTAVSLMGPCRPAAVPVMGRDRGTAVPVMGRDRGTYDVMGPGGSPREMASFSARRVKTPSR